MISAVVKKVLHPTRLGELQGADRVVGWCTGLACVVVDPTTGFVLGIVLGIATQMLMRGSFSWHTKME